jgi:hypothetical protein
MENSELEALQRAYKQAIDQWVNSIREEESLASQADFSVISLDNWEHARMRQEQAGEQVKDARKEYEDGLRQTYYGF